MNLLFHQFRKDLRHSRVLVILWLMLVISRFALAGWNVDPSDAGMQAIFSMVSVLTLIFGYLLILVLVPQVIHQEPLVGTLAFWFTRPLSRATLLSSKGLFFALMIALPLIVQTIVFLTNGVTLHDVVLAVPQLFLSEATWMLSLAVLAVLTPTTGRFIVIGAIILVSIYVLAFMVQVFRIFSGGLYMTQVDASLTGSRTVVSDVLLIGLATAAVVNQYLTRRTSRTIVFAAAALLTSQLVGFFWPWDFLKSAVALTADHNFRVDILGTPSLVGDVSVSDQAAFRGGDPTKVVHGTIVVPGCPKGYLIKLTDIDSTLRGSDGKTVETSRSFNEYGGYNQPARETIEQALGGVPILNQQGASNGLFVDLFTLSTATYHNVVASDLNYTGRLTGYVYKYASTAELPIVKGGRFVEGSNRETIINVLEQGKGVDIQVQKQSVKLLLAPKPDDDRRAYLPGRGAVLYVLVNRKKNQAVVQKQGNFSFPSFMMEEILSHEPLRLSFGPENNGTQENLLPTLNKAWLADAVLVRLELAPVAVFSRTLTVPHFRLDGSFRGGSEPTVSTAADIDTLDKITLPANATRAQTQDYIQAILTASCRVDSTSDQDPQIRMLEQVGSQNVDLLIDLARTTHNFYLNHAITDLARDDHRDAVIAAFPTNPDLIDTIVVHHWEKAAAPALLAILSENNPAQSGTVNRGETIARALASLKDPATYPTLKTYYINRPDRHLFDQLAQLPDFDLKSMVDEAWKRRGTAEWSVRKLIGPALQFNEPDVIDTAIQLLKANDDYTRQTAVKALRTYTPAVGANEAEVLAWMTAQKDTLVFDPASKKFVLKDH